MQRLARARHVGVLTGAGISAESGIPTFRDPGGLWDQFRPEDLANVHAFLNNPVLVQTWYEHRRSVAQEKQPNAGHLALAELESLVDDFTLITQNVDDLHRRAGSRRILELHGNIMRSFCIECGRPAQAVDLKSTARGEPARCRACNGLIRPDVVWFGEMLPEGIMEQAEQAAERAEVFLTVGTSALVYPAAGLPQVAGDRGAYTAEINIEPSAVSHLLDEVLVGPAGVILPQLVAAVQEERRNISTSER